MICAGIDAGSRSIKVVLFDSRQQRVLASSLADQGVAQERLAEEAFEHALNEAGISRSDVAAGVQTAVASRTMAIADLSEAVPTYFTGCVAL